MITTATKPKRLKTRPLSMKQKEILNFINEQVRQFGKPPSIRAIAVYRNITPNAAYCHLKSIESKGKLTRINGKIVTIQLGAA